MRSWVRLVLLVVAMIPVSHAVAQPQDATRRQTDSKQEAKVAEAWRNALQTTAEVAQAKVAALEASLALQKDQSVERARKALEESRTALTKAKCTATEETRVRIVALEKRLQAVEHAIQERGAQAHDQVAAYARDVAAEADRLARATTETKEVRAMRARVAELRARAALLSANLAADAGEAKNTIQSYLDEASEQYEVLRRQLGEMAEPRVKALQQSIGEAREAVETRAHTMKRSLADLLDRAAELLRDEDE